MRGSSRAQEIAKRKARDEQDHRVRVVSVVVAARRLMERQASAEAEAEAAAKRPPRAPYEKNDRARAVKRMNAFSDNKFKARYRVSRSTFNIILERIAPDLEPADRAKPGGCPNGTIPAQLKLGATRRFLAGSNHLHAMCTCARELPSATALRPVGMLSD
jgi:hypothetical protein